MSSPCKLDIRDLMFSDDDDKERYSDMEISSSHDQNLIGHPNVPDNVEILPAQTDLPLPGFTNPAFTPDKDLVSSSIQNRLEAGNQDLVKNTSDCGRSMEISGCNQSEGLHNGDENEVAWGTTDGQQQQQQTSMEIMPKVKKQNHNRSKSTSFTFNQQDDWRESDNETFIAKKIRALNKAFSSRAQRIKEKIIQPPTPSPSPPPEDSENLQGRPRLQSLIQHEDDGKTDDIWLDEMVDVWCCQMKRRYIPSFPKVLDPQSKIYISWLFIVTACFLYNAWAIFLRAIFPYQTNDNKIIFLGFDYFSDITYLIDIMVFKVRVQYLHDGFWVDDPEMTRKNYFKKNMFKMDLLSLLPFDLLYLKYGIKPCFRLCRLLKVQTFWEFFNRVDAVAKSPYVIRILRTLIYMMFLIHLNACAYYAMSDWEKKKIGFNRSNRWVFNGEGNAYIRCFYFATKTATSIGKNPKPENVYEYAFMTVSWLMGVFIFAFLIGQIRDIVATATQSKTQYRQLMDQTVQYMRNLGLPYDLQRRVRLWLNHTWEQQKTLNEGAILDSLPRKMKTDVAINVHYNTLVKVQLFKDCDKALLRDLVLKLKPVLFLPGDYICMKGEVGKEMYIVNKGLVQVVGGEESNVVLATLSEGSVFGEISLLGIPGFSRRTADVRSKGFSNLFVLSKFDLWDALKNYPEAQKLLRKKAKSLIKQNEALRKQESSKKLNVEVIIKDPPSKPSTPKLVHTVMQVVPAGSKCRQMLKKSGSKYRSKTNAVKPVGSIRRPSRDKPIDATIIKKEDNTISEDSLEKSREATTPPCCVDISDIISNKSSKIELDEESDKLRDTEDTTEEEPEKSRSNEDAAEEEPEKFKNNEDATEEASQFLNRILQLIPENKSDESASNNIKQDGSPSDEESSSSPNLDGLSLQDNQSEGRKSSSSPSIFSLHSLFRSSISSEINKSEIVANEISPRPSISSSSESGYDNLAFSSPDAISSIRSDLSSDEASF